MRLISLTDNFNFIVLQFFLVVDLTSALHQAHVLMPAYFLNVFCYFSVWPLFTRTGTYLHNCGIPLYCFVFCRTSTISPCFMLLLSKILTFFINFIFLSFYLMFLGVCILNCISYLTWYFLSVLVTDCLEIYIYSSKVVIQ